MSDLEKFSQLMFDEQDYVCAGSLFDNTVAPFLASVGSMFYTINPIDGRVDHGHKDKESYDFMVPRRADINCSSFRNFIFEMDNETLENQMIILESCGIPWTAIVYSGSKSYHALLSLDESLEGCHTKDGIENYKNIWKRLSLKIEHCANCLGFQNVIDQSSKNPSRFTRFPTTVRDNGQEQAIMSLGTRISFQDFSTLLASCPKIFTNVVRALNSLEIESVEDFFEDAPTALINEVKYPTNLQSSSMYPTILRLSMWARDLGVSKEIWLNVLNYRYFKALLAAGYPEAKLTVAVDHAFRT